MTDSAIRDQIAISARRHFERHTTQGDPRAEWRTIAELGWIAAAVPEAQGGIGGSAETAILAREFALSDGQAPFLEAGVLPAAFFGALGTDEALLGEILSGERIVVAATTGLRPGPTFADGRISGRIDAVFGGDLADAFLVLGDGAWLVDRNAPGLDVTALPSIDGRTACVLRFAGVAPAMRFDATAAPAALDAAMLAQCEQLVALMRRMMELTREHLLTRVQFGQPLATFQALRHRYADMFAECEQAAAILDTGHAAIAADAQVRARAVSACRLRVGQAAQFVGAQAVQLHGAMAMTEEYELGRLYKRTLVLRKLWGDETDHAARMIALPRQPIEWRSL